VIAGRGAGWLDACGVASKTKSKHAREDLMSIALPTAAALLATLLAPGLAPAVPPTTACQRAVAAGGAKFAMVALKISQHCAMRASQGALLASCRALAGQSTGDRTTDAALGRAAKRLAARVGDACARADLAPYARRCADPTGPPLTVTELLACLRDTHLDRVGAMVAVEFPGLAARTASAAASGCDSTQVCQCTCSSPSGSFLVPLTGDVL
jgi:hypothetical protein